MQQVRDASITLSALSWSKPDAEHVLTDLDLALVRSGRARRKKWRRKNHPAQHPCRYIETFLRHGCHPGTRRAGEADARPGAGEIIADLFGATQALAVLRRAETGEATLEELENADWTVEERIMSALVRLGLEARRIRS